MGTKDEINKMFDALEGGVSNSNETDAPTTDEPVETDAPTTDEPVETDAPETDAPETRAPTTDAPEDDELARARAENEELKRKLAEKEAPKTEVPTTSAPATDPPIEEVDFLEGVDMEDVEPKELNKVLNSLYQKAVTKVRSEMKKNSETVLKVVPGLITKDMNLQKTLKKMTDNFYKNNEDLKPFAKVVGVVFDETIQQNPGKETSEVLNMVGEETRKRLGLKKPNKSKEKGNNKNTNDDPPPLHRKTGRKVTSQNQETEGVTSEIDEMNKSLNR